MEPMTLGSPSGSPATNANPYLPSFLLGETQLPATSNTLSPNKGGQRNLSFVSPLPNSSSSDYNRSLLGQKTLFGYQQTVPANCGTPVSSFNASVSGPPTQGLFDTLRTEQNQVLTSTHLQGPNQYGTPKNTHTSFNINQSYQQQQPYQSNQFNESNMSNASYNHHTSRSILSPCAPGGNIHHSSFLGGGIMTPSHSNNSINLWVTVFGFSSSSVSTVLQHFAQCGTIIEKVFPPQNGNWVHLKYSSRLECDNALTYNAKILSDNNMIGVSLCKDKHIIDKENMSENTPTQANKVRPLVHADYKLDQSAVVGKANAPQKNNGIMDKAMDLLFGW